MLKFPAERIVHKGSVFHFLCVVGGLLMTVTAGGGCVDVAVRAARHPANLLRLSSALIGLVGLRYQMRAYESITKRKLKRLHFTESFNSLLHITRTTLQGTPDFKVLCWFSVSSETQTHRESTPAHLVSAKRCGVYYILMCGVSSRPVLTLFIGNKSSRLKTYNPSNPLQWLMGFSGEAQTRGDVIFLFVGGQAARTNAASAANEATNEPGSLTLGLSALSAVLLWMLLPHIAVCAVIYLSWKPPTGPERRCSASNEITAPYYPLLLPLCSGSLLASELNLLF